MSKPFSHTRLVSALTKAGMIITKDEHFSRSSSSSNYHYIATNPKNDQRIDWYTQAAFVPFVPATATQPAIQAHYDNNKQVVSSVCKRHPQTDAQSDLFMDSFRDTIKGALSLLERPY